MSSIKKSPKLSYKSLIKRHPTTIKETKFFGTTNSFDEHSTQQSPFKCESPKFFRTQSFGIMSPKSQIKFFANLKSKNSITKDNSASVSDSDERTNSRSGNCSESSVSSLAQVNEIFDESCEFDVSELRGLERLKRLRCRFRKSSFSVESNVNGNGRNKRYVRVPKLKFKNYPFVVHLRLKYVSPYCICT